MASLEFDDPSSMDPATLAQAIRARRALAAAQAEEAKARQELDALLAPKKSLIAAQRKYGAASSHVLNDRYMNDFEKAWEQLMAEEQGSSADANPTQSGNKAFLLGPKAGQLTSKRPDSRAAIGSARTRNLVNYAKTTAAAALPRWAETVLSTWRTGPEDPAGALCDISDRPSLCSSAHWGKNEVVVGSSDHALYVMDAEKGTKKRQLYNKTSGHSEWVTAVTFTPDGKIVSGGMDSCMWLWAPGSTRGMKMEGHGGPISALQYDGCTGMVVSTSYDKTVRLWQCGSRGEEKMSLVGHEAPVMHLDINNQGKIITGDRSGHIILWDVSASDVSWRMKGVHKGQTSALAWCDAEDSDIGGLFMSGGQDGYVRAWDHRERKNPAKIQLHVGTEGRGAVSSICAGGPAAAHHVVTCGADKTVRVLDPRKSFGLMHTVQLADYPYSMAVAGGLALVGCGDGSLSVIDIREGRCLYALGAHHNSAVRCIEAFGDRLMTTGDDGNTMLFKFPATAPDEK